MREERCNLPDVRAKYGPYERSEGSHGDAYKIQAQKRKVEEGRHVRQQAEARARKEKARQSLQEETMIMDERAVEAAIRTLGRELTSIKTFISEQNRILSRIVDHQGRLIDLLEKLVKKDQK